MITPRDKEYKATKQIKRGKLRLDPPLSKLAKWISDRYGVTVLNLVHDKPDLSDKMRLQVIVEFEGEMAVFRDGYNFDITKQNEIAKEFCRIVPNASGDLFVVFSSFAHIAKQEANDKISKKEIAQIVREIANQDLWTIHKQFFGATLFFYTEKQKDKHEKAGMRRWYSDLYYQYLTKYDEFRYINKAEFWVQFDSKEIFDKKYNGNWFYYDR